MTRWRLPLIVVFFLGCPIFGAEATDGSRVASVFLKGEIVDNVMTVSITPGLGVTKAVRVYTEPSHTLVAAVVDDAEAVASEAAWYETTFGNLAATQRDVPVIRTALREGKIILLSTLAPPNDDIRLRIVLNGVWDDGDGTVQQREVSFYVATRLASFAFTYNRVLRDLANQPVAVIADADPWTGKHTVPEVPRRDVQRSFRLQPFGNLCCGTPPTGCRYACEECPGENYGCCNETDTACGWCNKIVAQCNTQCPMC